MTRAIGNLVATWANNQIDFTAIGMNVNASAYHANSKVIRLKLNGGILLCLDANGIFILGNVKFPVDGGPATHPTQTFRSTQTTTPGKAPS